MNLHWKPREYRAAKGSFPNFPKQLFQDGVINKNDVCITCSKCSEFMKHGKSTGCVIRDPYYKVKK